MLYYNNEKWLNIVAKNVAKNLLKKGIIPNTSLKKILVFLKVKLKK